MPKSQGRPTTLGPQRWIEVPLDDDTWVAAVLVDIHQGDLRVLEFRVLPQTRRRTSIGEWPTNDATRMRLGNGIGSALIRRASRQAILAACAAFIIEQTGAPGSVEKRFLKSKKLDSDWGLALVAVEYDSLIKFGVPKPAKVLAAEFGLSEHVARDRIRRARRKGFLTPGHQGKAGGTLTATGRAAAKLSETEK